MATSTANGSAPGAGTGIPEVQWDLLGILGATGLKRYAGRVYEEWLPELSGDQWRRVVREMAEQDPMVGAMLFCVEMLMRQVEWTVTPADDSNEAHAVAAYFDTVLNDMSQPFAEVLAEILSMLPYGWALMEIIYKIRGGPDTEDPTRRSRYNDGRVGWRKLSIRAQDTLYRWEFDAEGGIQGMWQIAPPDFKAVLIPIDKALLYRTKARRGNPEGVSVLRSAYRPWYFKKRIENLEGVGIERDLAGLPIAEVPANLLSPDATPSEQQQVAEIKKLVTSIRRDEQEGVVWPRSFDADGNEQFILRLLSTGGTRQFDTTAIVNAKDQRMAMTMMADFLLMGHQQVGTFSLVSNRTEMFATAIGSFLDVIADVTVEHGWSRLMRINQFPPELRPGLQHGDIESVDLNIVGGYLKNLAGAGLGLFPDEDLKRWALQQAGMPVPETDEDEVDQDSIKSAPQYTAPEGDVAGLGQPLGGKPPTGSYVAAGQELSGSLGGQPATASPGGPA